LSEPEPQPTKLNPERLEYLGKLLSYLEGKDPEAQQTLNKFLKFESNIERSNLPLRSDVHLVAYLGVAGQAFFPDIPDNPFSVFANELSIAFMALKGNKANQFVDLMRNVPNLTDLQESAKDSAKRGILDSIFSRRRSEE
jgi:hypothetical protein